MKERCFGPIRFIPGENRGKYPFCHSLYIDGAGILIDPASDRNRLKRLYDENGVREVWLSHWHEDHFMHLDLFEEVPLLISEQDAPQLSALDLFLDGYGIEKENHRQLWRDIIINQFHFRPRNPARFLKGGQQIRLKDLTIDIIHTPGHTPGSACYQVGNDLLTGDTLFVFGCGRCDLRGGDPEQMYVTLKDMADRLPTGTVIRPGHNYAEKTTVTMEEQLQGNPFMHFDNGADFTHYRMHYHDRHRDSPYAPVRKGEEMK